MFSENQLSTSFEQFFKSQIYKHKKVTGSTVLNGEHYLVDAIGNMARLTEDGLSEHFIANHRHRQ